MDENNQPVVGWGNGDPAFAPTPPAPQVASPTPAPAPTPTSFAAPAPVWESAPAPVPAVPSDPAPMPPFMPAPAFSRPPVPSQPAAPILPPTPSTPTLTPVSPAADVGQSTPVVRVLSTHGLEYFMLSVALWFGAFSLGGIILSLINGGTSFDVLSFPTAALVVSVAVFAWLFMRLKKAELLNPALRLDTSKRRVSQMTQIGSFVISFGAVIGMVYAILTAIAGSSHIPLGKVLANLIVVLAIAGGILVYYWSDEHERR